MARGRSLALCCGLALFLSGCAPIPPNRADPADPNRFSVAALLALLPADAILLGEQHDAPDHPGIQQRAVAALAESGLLAALVLEMADQSAWTHGLARTADEAEVKTRLNWNDGAWPWLRYGPAVMGAVRAGVVVAGGNLAHAWMPAAMSDTNLDTLLNSSALERQRQDMRDGHCGLLPEGQIAPMARIQIARDASMAKTVQALAAPGKTVLLLAGAAHADRNTGVPVHWQAGFQSASIRLRPSGGGASNGGGHFDLVWSTQSMAQRDYCAELKQRVKPNPASP